jgi:hypothetical protein
MVEVIITAALGAGGIVTAILKYKKYVKAVREIAEVVQVSAKAFEDGKLTADEFKAIYKEIKDVVKIFAPKK